MDDEMVGKIRVQMTVHVDGADDAIERRVFKLFSPEAFLVSPVAGTQIWAAGGHVTASIHRVIIDPDEPLAVVACSSPAIDEDMFKELLDDGWTRMRSKGHTDRVRKLIGDME